MQHSASSTNGNKKRPATPEPSLNDMSMGGLSINGMSLGGASVNGVSLSGLSINGGSVAGGSVAGGSTAGGSISGLSVGGLSVSGLNGLDGPRLPPLPEIGQDEHVYARLARIADEHADREARDAAKVGLYVTLAIHRNMKWAEKLRHFRHALDKHCHASRNAATRIWKFYHALAHLVKENCGQEALRIASRKDDVYAARLAMGVSRAEIEASARKFFLELIGDGINCPDHMLPDDFVMIRMIRDQWV